MPKPELEPLRIPRNRRITLQELFARDDINKLLHDLTEGRDKIRHLLVIAYDNDEKLAIRVANLNTGGAVYLMEYAKLLLLDAQMAQGDDVEQG